MPAVQRFVRSDQTDRCRHRAVNMVALDASAAKGCHHAVADKLLDHASADRDRPDDPPQVRIQHRQQAGGIVWRIARSDP